MPKIFHRALPFIVLLLPGALFGGSMPTDIVGEWKGTLAGKFRLLFKITPTVQGGLSSVLISLDQGGQEVPVDQTTFTDGDLVLEVKALKGSYQGKLSADGKGIKGRWTQGGTLPLDLTRSTEAPPTPVVVLEPKPPFPYKTENITFGNPEAKIELAGTLTYPDRAGPFPAVLLIQGSGKVDRDETTDGHKPFLVLSDALTRAGLAVLRFDKRGIGASTGDYETYTSRDMAEDTRWALDYLLHRKEVDPKRIGLLGHSEGGIIAPMVASSSPQVSFIVILGAPGIKGEELAVLQATLVNKMAGVGEAAILANEKLQRRIFGLIREGGNAEETWQKCAKAVDDEIAGLDPDLRAKIGEKTIDKVRADLKGSKRFLLSPWFRAFIDYDPAPVLSKVRCPVLAVTGEKDLQVPANEDLSGIESALRNGGNKDFTVQTLPGLNHLLQTCGTGSPSEYAAIPETISISALNLITHWILEHSR